MTAAAVTDRIFYRHRARCGSVSDIA